MSKRAARLALVFALLGLGASATAAYVHYHLLYDPHYTSFCDVSETVSCSQVYLSRFSTVTIPGFGGSGSIPVSLFAVIWFAFAALLSVGALVGRQEVRDSIPGYLFAGVDDGAGGDVVPAVRVRLRPQNLLSGVSDD